MSLLASLVSYWPLDEASGTRADAHASNHLTDNNTVGSAAGRVGLAADFEAANMEWLHVPDNASLSVGDIDFTACGRFQLESLTALRPVIGQYNAGGANQRSWVVQCSHNTGKAEAIVSSNGTDATTLSHPDALTLGAWYFVAFWHDAIANTINVQLNNGAVASQAYASGVHNGTGPFAVGGRYFASGIAEYFDGLIDGCAVWKRAQTAAERSWLYNGGSGRAYADLPGYGSAAALLHLAKLRA